MVVSEQTLNKLRDQVIRTQSVVAEKTKVDPNINTRLNIIDKEAETLNRTIIFKSDQIKAEAKPYIDKIRESKDSIKQQIKDQNLEINNINDLKELSLKIEAQVNQDQVVVTATSDIVDTNTLALKQVLLRNPDVESVNFNYIYKLNATTQAITINQLDYGTCNPDPIVPGQLTTCTFPVLAAPAGVTFIAQTIDIKALVTGSTGVAVTCTTNATVTVTTCANIPSVGAPANKDTPILLTQSGSDANGNLNISDNSVAFVLINASSSSTSSSVASSVSSSITSSSSLSSVISSTSGSVTSSNSSSSTTSTTTPNDTYFNQQWYLNNTGQKYKGIKDDAVVDKQGTPNVDINVLDAWSKDTSNRGQGQVVAIQDDGVDIAHPDLENNIWVNQGEVPASLKTTIDGNPLYGNNDGKVKSREILKYLRAIPSKGGDYNKDGYFDLLDVISTTGSPFIDGEDNDGNGYKDDFFGWNFSDDNNFPVGYGGTHGTFVAGFIAAEANNSEGILGIASNAEVMALQIFSSNNGKSTTGASIGATIYSKANGAKVINMSYGGPTNNTLAVDEQRPEGLAIISAYNSGVSLVASSGNDANDAGNQTPGKFKQVITVAATDSNNDVANFSNFGPDIDVAAPGVDTLSLQSQLSSERWTSVFPNYTVSEGTSFSAPITAGVVTLIRAKYPNMTPGQIKQLIRTSSLKANSRDFTADFGYGYLDAGAALSASSTDKFTDLKLEIYNSDGVLLDNKSSVTGKINLKAVIDTPVNSWELYYYKDNGTLASVASGGALAAGSNSLIPAGYDTINFENNSRTTLILKTINDNATNKISLDNVGVTPKNVDLSPKTKSYKVFGKNNSVDIAGSIVSNYQSASLKYYQTDGTNQTNSGTLTIKPSCLTSGCVNTNISTLDTGTITNTGLYTLELKVRPSGLTNDVVVTSKFYFDNSLSSGWPRQLPADDVESNNSAYLGLNNFAPNVGDINGDGKVDLVFNKQVKAGRTANTSDFNKTNIGISSIFALDSNGKDLPGFPMKINPTQDGYSVKENIITSKLTLTDINKDGKTDVCYLTNTNGISQPAPDLNVYCVGYINNTLQTLPNFPVSVYTGIAKEEISTTVRAISMAAGDIDGDTIPDLVFTTIAGKTIVVSGTGNTKPVKIWSQTSTKSVTNQSDTIRSTPSIADIDKDGQNDVVTVVGDSVYVFKKDGTVLSGWPKQGTDTIMGSVAVGDVNGDGNLEIASIDSGTGTLHLYNKSGVELAGFPKTQTETITAFQYLPSASYTPALANLDNDPDLEIVVARNIDYTPTGGTNILSKGMLWAYKKDGTVLSGWPKDLNPVDPARATTQFTMTLDIPVIADIDSDGVNDIVIGNGLAVYAFSANGTPKTNFPKIINPDVNADPISMNSPLLTDFDGDGKIDLLASLGTSSLDTQGSLLFYPLNATYNAAKAPWPTQYQNLSNAGLFGGLNPVSIAGSGSSSSSSSIPSSTSSSNSVSSSISSSTSVSSSTTSSSSSTTSTSTSSQSSSSSSSATNIISTYTTKVTAIKDAIFSIIPVLTVGVNNGFKAKIDKIEPTFDQDVSNVDFSYSLISDNGSCTDFSNTNKIHAGSFGYGFDKAKIRNIKMTFTTEANILNVKAYSCSSPTVQQTVQSLGNNQYSVVIPASSTFIITGDTIPNNINLGSSTIRTGGPQIGILIISIISGAFIVLVITKARRKKLTLGK